ncbi:MAG TPA: hypothetical protein VGX68_21000 [Thermoanaerobaculia bacterium]|jgi:photosystem II stability/assembly factor-like uncharacterized protein|nr:hypothetical protein [Thermoanaerobaculia bacterium]
MHRRVRSVALAILLFPAAAFAAPAVDPDLLAGLKARSIGPAAMSGRIASVDVAESNPDLMYVGSATGGVWKSVNGGLTWAPIFDDQPVASIGAVAVNQSNPDVVWVGTGEGNPRNSVSIGNGIYRSLDGGKTWAHLGLEATERIHRVILHPSDPNVAWVAAMGQAWGENADRGVFKTTDGGKTWRKVLYVDPRTGAADMVIDPSNPNKLFAAMWDYRRYPWLFRSGGPGSGLYVTYDGGETWQRLNEDDGLPKGDLGRIGLAISRSNPNIVYALVEAEKSALCRSTDGGKTWEKVNEDQRTAERPFYYADIETDPVWPNRLYSLTARLRYSEDSGKTFNTLGRSREVHGDYHAIWINPKDPNHIVTGSDGGVAVSHDRGETWWFIGNIPVGQFYHVAVDMETPYNIYGGLQDNGSWRGPSSLWEGGGIRNYEWEVVGGGDGFDTRPDPERSTAGYSMSQGGELTRWDLRSREFKPIKPPEPKPGSGLEKLRFNWNAGIGQDPFEPGTIYYGSQYVHKSTDRGDSWTVISPDLTSDNPEWQQSSKSGGLTPDVTAAENFTTIISIAPSPKQKGVIWVGTDDGRLHVTRDGGGTWTSVEKNVSGVPANTWIPHILPSKYDAASAFVVFDNHRREDFKPYVYRTDDWGKTWKSLATKDLRGYALSIEQDPVDKDLLFLGTEFGLWVSLDGGAKWLPWRHGVPTVSVMDLVIHPRDLDLVIGTHGRALFVLDDITPLREVSAEALAEPVHLFPSAPAVLHRNRPGGGGIRGGGAGEFQGQNREYGAFITYSLNAPGLPLPDSEKERARKEAERSAARARAAAAAEKPGGETKEDQPTKAEVRGRPSAEEAGGEEGKDKEPKVEIRITDAAGKLIRKMEGPAKLGINRVTWDFGRDSFRRPPMGERGAFFLRDSGPVVGPGTYTVTVKYKDKEAKQTLQVNGDTALGNTDADWQAREAFVTRAGALQNAVTDAIARVSAAKDDVKVVLAKLDARKKERERAAGGDVDPKKDDPDKPLATAARDLQKKLSAVEKRLYIPPDTKGIVKDETPLSKVMDAGRFAESTWSRPTPTATANLEEAETVAKAVLADFNKLFAEDVAAFRQKVAEAGIGLFGEQGPIEVSPHP